MAAAPALWTPADITTFYWIDSSDSATITLSGSNVSQWDDKSGNGFNATQATDAFRPGLTGALNGLNIVYWDGTKKMDLPNMAWGSKNISYYSVTNNTGGLTAPYRFSVNLVMKKAGTDSIAALSNTVTGGKFIWYTGTGADLNYSGTNSQTPQIQTTFSVVSQTGNASTNTAEYWWNGDSRGNNVGGWNGTSGPFSNAFLGNDEYGSSTFGNIAEIVIVNQVDSTAERERMEGYLAWKWGLEANLPINHPYYNAPPFV